MTRSDEDPPALPAPPARSLRTLLWTSTTYFGEGLPWTFLHQMVTEFLTAIGGSGTVISSTSLFHLAVVLKLLWSPVVDFFGTKRGWVIATQVALAGGMFIVSRLVTGSLAPFWIATAMFSIVHATHDIACDGFYMQALDRHDQALFSGMRTAGYRAAMATGGGALVYLAGRTSWQLGFGAAGALMLLVAVLNGLVMPHPPEPTRATDAREPNTEHAQLKKLWSVYRSFFAQPHAALVLSLMFFYKIGDIMMFAMSKPLLRDIGIDTSTRGILNLVGTIFSVSGTILGGAIVARLGLARCLVPFTYIQNFAIPLYILMAVVKPGLAGVVPIIILEQLASGLGYSTHTVFLMQRSRMSFSASHFAFATALVALGSTLAGYVSGPLNDRFGHPWFFTIAFLASVPSLVLVLIVPKNPVERAP